MDEYGLQVDLSDQEGDGPGGFFEPRLPTDTDLSDLTSFLPSSTSSSNVMIISCRNWLLFELLSHGSNYSSAKSKVGHPIKMHRQYNIENSLRASISKKQS